MRNDMDDDYGRGDDSRRKRFKRDDRDDYRRDRDRDNEMND